MKITLNENYILLISKLIDENFDDLTALVSKLKFYESKSILQDAGQDLNEIDDSSQHDTLAQKKQVADGSLS